MTFLAPYMLWGAAAASIPIALHFFFRSRYRVVPWAAMKFLLTSIEQTSRRLRFQELLLLLLRVALLVVLALALARPLSSVVGGAGRGEAVDAVFVVDTSFSMGGKDGAKTRLQKAQDTALAIIDQLPPHSTVQIVACADRARVVGPRSPANLDQAKTIVQELKTTSLATDLSWGINQGLGVLQRGQASNKELYVFSDMQKAGWERQAGKIKEAMKDWQSKTAITLIRCGDKPLKNAALVSIAPQTGIPRPGERVGFAVLVRNTGSEAIENLQVSLMVDEDEKTKDSQVIDKLAAKETRAVTLTAKMGKAGLRKLSAQIKSDDLEGDNRLDQVLMVREQVNILVVDGSPNLIEPELAGSFFLMHALLPVKEADRATYYLQPRVTSPRLASPALLGRQDLCILVNTPLEANAKKGGEVLPADFVEELGRFVRQGHGLVIFSGEHVDVDAYNRILGKELNLLPLPMKKLHEFPEKEPVKLARNSFQLPAFNKFKDDDYYKGFANVEVLRAIELAEPERGKKETVILIQGELPPGTKPADVEKLFAPFGKVLKVEFLKEVPEKKLDVEEKEETRELQLRVDSEPPGDKDAVRVELEDNADKAVRALHQKEFMKRKLIGVDKGTPVVIVRYGNGMPAVVTRKVGEGEVVLVTTAAEPGFKKDVLGPTWTDWPLRLNLYVPFVDVTVNYLLHGQTQNHNVVAGETLAWQLADKKTITYDLIRPNGERVRLGTPKVDEGRASLTISDLPDAGFYRVAEAASEKESGEGIPETPLGVVPDLAESDNLETLSDAQLGEFLGFEPRVLLAGGAMGQETGAERLNREWTMWLLALVLGLALCESLLAYWCGRSW